MILPNNFWWLSRNLADPPFECYFTEVIPPNNFWWLSRSTPPPPSMPSFSKQIWVVPPLTPSKLFRDPTFWVLSYDSSPLLFSQKSTDPPLKCSSALPPPPPTGDKYRPVPNPSTVTSATQANDFVMQTQVLPPPRAPLAFLSRLKLSFPSLSNACHAGTGSRHALQANSGPTTGGFQNNLFSDLLYFSQFMLFSFANSVSYSVLSNVCLTDCPVKFGNAG